MRPRKKLKIQSETEILLGCIDRRKKANKTEVRNKEEKGVRKKARRNEEIK